MAKVCIDAGHFGRYNRSPVNTAYFESVQMWALSRHLGTALRAQGIETVYTRANMNIDMELTERGRKAKGCDLFISLHSNAAESETVDYPVAYVPLNGTGTTIGKRLADCVCTVMGTVQKGRTATRKGSTGLDYYGVIRGAVSVGVPGIILEHSFHTNKKATEWLLKESRLKELAEAEAECIAKYLKSTGAYNSGVTAVDYKVRVSIDDLNIRKGPGVYFPKVKYIRPGVYTITGEADGNGASKWLRLKSGAGWISADFVTRVQNNSDGQTARTGSVKPASKATR